MTNVYVNWNENEKINSKPHEKMSWFVPVWIVPKFNIPNVLKH